MQRQRSSEEGKAPMRTLRLQEELEQVGELGMSGEIRLDFMSIGKQLQIFERSYVQKAFKKGILKKVWKEEPKYFRIRISRT